MENKSYKDMTKEELWNEIILIISVTNLTEVDKEMIKDLIQIWSIK